MFIEEGVSVRGLANWILDYADELGLRHTNMGLNKLVFFAVQETLLKDKVLLTKAKIEAWEHGPVFREVYQGFKRFGDKPITGRLAFFSPATGQMEEPRAALEEGRAQALRVSLRPFMEKSASELRRISHLPDTAWHKVWWYDGHTNPGMEISALAIFESNRGVAS